MSNNLSRIIDLPKFAIQEKEGIVILPLKKWKKIEEYMEDLEMFSSEGFAEEIEKRRKEKGSVPLDKLIKKYNI